MKQRFEYRVLWKRDGQPMKRKRYVTRAGVDHFLTLLGPEPWKAYRKDPDALDCCPGASYECACEGKTVREASDQRRSEMPKLEWLRVEMRTVGRWASTDGVL